MEMESPAAFAVVWSPVPQAPSSLHQFSVREREQRLEGVKRPGFKSSIALSSMGCQIGLSSW